MREALVAIADRDWARRGGRSSRRAKLTADKLQQLADLGLRWA
ncbi:hypothetical protein AB0K74_33690 [Streptomyces sp. NPDC056159]